MTARENQAETRAWRFPTARGYAACTPSNKPCCSPAPFPWPISPFTIWISGLLEKGMNSFIKIPRPWALSLSREKWPPLIRAKTVPSRFTTKPKEKTAASKLQKSAKMQRKFPGRKDQNTGGSGGARRRHGIQ